MIIIHPLRYDRRVLVSEVNILLCLCMDIGMILPFKLGGVKVKLNQKSMLSLIICCVLLLSLPPGVIKGPLNSMTNLKPLWRFDGGEGLPKKMPWKIRRNILKPEEMRIIPNCDYYVDYFATIERSLIEFEKQKKWLNWSVFFFGFWKKQQQQ